MKDFIKLWKREGQTPLEAIEDFKQDNPEYRDQKMTYAGRLDPLAEGELILLAGENVKEKEKYTALDKEYETEILLGIETDSFDSLGKVIGEGVLKNNWKERTESFLEKHKGEFEQEYPPFSSKTIDGVPMFELAKRGELSELPKHKVRLISIEIISFGEISKTDLLEEIQRKNSLVKGDFRQDEIAKIWKDYFTQSEIDSFPIVKLKLVVSSGFYVRAFASDLGKFLGSGAFALKIVRTKVITKELRN